MAGLCAICARPRAGYVSYGEELGAPGNVAHFQTLLPQLGPGVPAGVGPAVHATLALRSSYALRGLSPA